nr:hypothetical protein [Bacteroides fragilis]
MYRYTVRFNEEEHTVSSPCSENRVSMHGLVFLKAHFFGQPFKGAEGGQDVGGLLHQTVDFHAQSVPWVRITTKS